MDHLQVKGPSPVVAPRSNRSARLIALLFPIAFALGAHAQLDVVYIFGTVKDYFSAKKIDGVTVTVYKNGAKLTDVRTNASGKYDINLDYGADYKLVYAKQGMISKIISLDTRNVPEEDRVGGHGFNLEMTLFNDMPGVDFSILQQPIGKAKFDQAKGEISWDFAYTEQIRNEVNRLMKEYEDKKKREAGAEAEYAKQMQAGEAAMKANDFKKAVASFSAALVAKPADPMATAKLSDAQMRLDEQEGGKRREEEYAALIKDGDALFLKKSYEEAKVKYNLALNIKENEAHPKARIKEIDRLLEEMAKKAEEERKAKELEEKYKAAIAAGDAAFKAEKWDDATVKYNDAIGLKPQEKYPKDQLAAIAQKKDEAAKKAEEERLARELNEKYQAAVKAGDVAFKAEKWDDAAAKYTEASGLKPDEKYPKDQLAAIALKKDAAARKAEEERLAKELDEKYKAAIAAGDAAFKSQKWEDATAKYNEALGLKANEKYPKEQLAAIQKKLDELAKKAEEERMQRELDERYQGIITEADKAFGKRDLAEARTRYQEASGLKPQERYPKDRLAEVAALEAELARKAEEERKQRELDERYAGLIAKADKAFTEEQWPVALNDYRDALQLKPGEAHPKNRIADIESKLDAAARAKAEEERLAREKQELEKRYNELVAAADKAFGQKKYEEAKDGYSGALGLKPDERHPKDRLAEIQAILADQASKAEADRLAEEQRRAEEERKRREKEEADAAELARLAELERQRNADAAAIEARFKELVAQADMAYTADDFDRARSKYSEALEVKPEAKHPKDRLAAMDAELARRDKARSEADRLAEEQRLRDEERRLREIDEAEARRLEEERQRMERDASKAIEERYRQSIIDADEALAVKEYDRARSLYSQASDIKPAETYPKSKIEQIDKLLAELERQREEAELAARRAEEARQANRQRSGNTIDTRKEQEAEQFMRAAREREEAEKYERIRKFRDKLEGEEADRADRSAERRSAEVDQNQRTLEAGAGVYEGDDARRRRNAEELEAYREALSREEARRAGRAAQERDAQYNEKLRREEDKQAFDRERDELQAQRNRQAANDAERIAQEQVRRTEAGTDRNVRNREEALETAERQQRMQDKGSHQAEANRHAVEDEKRAQQAREAGYAKASELARTSAQNQQAAAQAGGSRAFADINRSKLAQEYPPGVTEESYTEGNKVIIRRVVVNGNRADEYSKVIAKWGTFYFKNGQSISEAIWSKETEG
ncbi:MAG: hypothetical protein KIT10_01260 [Flavobacteriales bacterium]|nr:hypothetical protein [Flavobacteriales bacterium]